VGCAAVSCVPISAAAIVDLRYPVRVEGESPYEIRRKQMTQYVLTVYQPDGPPSAEVDLDHITREVGDVIDEMRAAGGWVFSGGLAPAASATVVRARDGRTLMTDGPYVEGKEHVGGFTIVDAPDLDAALEWAGRLAQATTLPIEVRPFHDAPEG
jgi:hypothetical protein